MGQKNDFYTQIKEKSDIFLLNELQFRSRESFIIFSSRTGSDYIKNTCKKIPASSLHKNNAWASNPTPSGKDKLKSTIATWRMQLKLKRWLSCCKIKNRVRRQKVECYERNPSVVEAHRLSLKKARSKQKAL